MTDVAAGRRPRSGSERPRPPSVVTPRPLRRRPARGLGGLPHRAHARRCPAGPAAGVVSLCRGARPDPRRGTPGLRRPGARRSPAASPTEQPEHYALSDPTLLVPAGVPGVGACTPRTTQVVPLAQATSYVARGPGRRRHGARLVTVPGDHFTLIDPQAPSFPTIRKLVDPGPARDPRRVRPPLGSRRDLPSRQCLSRAHDHAPSSTSPSSGRSPPATAARRASCRPRPGPR